MRTLVAGALLVVLIVGIVFVSVVYLGSGVSRILSTVGSPTPTVVSP